ncbi:MAG: hypothetical protein M3419_00685 [Actinomycetota bacterium]|nr:hypothetical protein [Actinomycetota bacterium]
MPESVEPAATVRIALPARQVATALVLRADPVDGDPDRVISASAHRLHADTSAALELHAGDLRTIVMDDLTQAPVPPVELLAALGADELSRSRVRVARAGIAIALVRPHEQSLSAQVAVRAAAVLLARDEDVVIDTAIPRVWPVTDPGSASPRTVDWIVLDRFHEQDTGLGTRTHGLARFGLPELCATGLDAGHLPAWDATLNGLAHVLVRGLSVAESPQTGHARELRLPAILTLSLADVAAAYAEPVDAADPTLARTTELHLALDTGADGAGVLRVTGAPADDLFG